MGQHGHQTGHIDLGARAPSLPVFLRRVTLNVCDPSNTAPSAPAGSAQWGELLLWVWPGGVLGGGFAELCCCGWGRQTGFRCRGLCSG